MKTLADLALLPFILAKVLISAAMCFIIIQWLSRVFACEAISELARITEPAVDFSTRLASRCLSRWIVKPLSPRQAEVITFFLLWAIQGSLAMIVP